jgi:hypothetical protein
MSSTVLSTLALSMIINQVPVQGQYLQSDQPACQITAQQATIWKAQGYHPVEKQVGSWCTVGTVINHMWVAEQWQPKSRAGQQTSLSEGWRIRIPLALNQQVRNRHSGDWGLDIEDQAIQARISVRKSSGNLALHHQSSLAFLQARALGGNSAARSLVRDVHSNENAVISRLDNGTVVLSGRHATEGSYSVVIQRSLSHE